MKRFRERNRAVVGAVGIAVVLTLVAGALNFTRLPLIHSVHTYQAEFPSAGGLATGDIVTVAGVKVGAITGMALAGAHVDVAFTAAGVNLGTRTSAAAKVLSPVGTEYMEVAPSGPGSLNRPIPLSRTTVPYNLVTDLSGLGNEIQHYDIPQLEKALQVTGQDLDATPSSETTQAFEGLARVSKVVGNEGDQLATVVTQGAALSGVLSKRSRQLYDLFGQSALVLSVLQQRKAAISQLLSSTATLSHQIDQILTVNRPQLTSLLDDLKSVSAVLSKDSGDIGRAIPVLAGFSRYAANTTGSGAFADVSLPTLLVPDNLVRQCSARGAFPSSNSQVGCRP
jgi:virulence factor Mce-like protein